MITNDTYLEIQQNTRWMLSCIHSVHQNNLSYINIFIAPSKGITALTMGNPAIYVRRKQMSIAVNNWQREMLVYAEQNPNEIIPHNLIHKGTCIIISENIMTWSLIERCGVLWHEYGHAYNELINRSNTELNAYLFEVEMIDWALKTNIFRDNGIGAGQILNYLDWRQPQFNMCRDTRLENLLTALRAHLNIMLRFRLIPA